jgi:hypothetical protein
MIAPASPVQIARREFMKRASIVVLGLLLFVVACKKAEQTTSSTETTATTVNTSATATASQPASTTPVPATTSPAPAAAAPAGVIASTEGEKPGVKIDITELKRASGGTVSLKFILSNSSDKDYGMASQHLADNETGSDYRAVSGIHLVDPVNKKKYFVVRDAEKNCLCSQAVDDIKSGTHAALWARFPAPPPEVQKVTIEIPHFQPLDDVPISQ